MRGGLLHAVDNVSITIPARTTLGVVGASGCGKSTLLRLLLGFEKPTKGAIYFSGQDISGVDIRSLRRHIGVVMQNGNLFQGDLLMNITVANPKATLDVPLTKLGVGTKITGTLRMKVIPGKEKGKIVVYIDKK